MRSFLTFILLLPLAGALAEITAPAELVSFPVEPGKYYRFKAVLKSPAPSSKVAVRFFDKSGKPVETVEKSLGMESSTRIVPVAADGSVTLEAIAGSGPNIPAVRAVLSLNSGKAEKFVRLDFSDALLAVRTGGIRTIPAETAGKFASNMIVNPSFEEGSGNTVSGWRYIGNGTPQISKDTFGGGRALLLTPADDQSRWETETAVPLNGNAPLWIGYWTKFNRYATIFGHPDILLPRFLKKNADGSFKEIPYGKAHEFNFYAYARFYGSWNFVFCRPFHIPQGATHVRFYTRNRDEYKRPSGKVKANFGNIHLDNVMAFQAAEPELQRDRLQPHEMFTALRPEGKLPPAVAPGLKAENTICLGAALSGTANLFFQCDNAGLKPEIRVNNLLPVSRMISVTGKISDSRGKDFGKVSAEVRVAGYGVEKITLPIPAKLPFGSYIVECTALEDNKVAGTGQLRFTYLEHPSRISQQEKSSDQYHFALHPSIKWWLTAKPRRISADFEQEANIFKMLGVRSIRIQTRYYKIDARNREEMLAQAQSLVDNWHNTFGPLLKKYGIRAYLSMMEQEGIVRIPKTPGELETWREYHKILAGGMAGSVDFILWGNEGLGGYTGNIPDQVNLLRTSHFAGNTREWFTMYREAYRGAKAGAAGLPFGPAHAADNSGMIAKRFFASPDSGREFDCWGVNAYQDSVGICQNVYKHLPRKAGRFGVVPEVGLNVPDRGKNRLEGERRQAEYVPQSYLQLFADAPFFTYVTFFITMYHQYGIFDTNWQPRPAAGAYAVMTDRLGAGKVEKKEPLPGGELYFWRRINGDIVGVGWSSRPQPVFVETDADTLTVDDLYGNHRTVPVVNGIAKIVLDREPVYILGAKKLQISRSMEISAGVALQGGNTGLMVTVGNQTGSERKIDLNIKTDGVVRVTPAARSLTLPAKGKQQVFFRVDALRQDDRKPLVFRINAVRDDGLNIEKVFRHPFVFCHPYDKTPGAWENAVPLHADRREQVELFSAVNSWNGMDDLSGVVRTLYDKDNFYLRISVKDDKMVPSGRIDRIFQHDGCELGFLIPQNGKMAFYQFTVGQTGEGAVLYQHLPATLQGRKTLPADAVKISRNEIAKVTEYEVALPWKLLDNFKPEPGKELRFGFLIDDSDGKPPHDRKAVGWYGIGIHEQRFSDFGVLVFSGKPQQKTAVAGNLVKNPSFKAGVTHWDRRVRTGKNGVRPEVDFTIAPDGVDDTAAARINSPIGGGRAIAEFSQLIPVKPDCEYYASLDVKVLRNGSWQAAYIEHLNEKRSQIAFTLFRMSPEVKKQPSNQWRKQQCRFRTKPNQRFIAVSLRLQHLGSGEVLYDNIEVVEIGK